MRDSPWSRATRNATRIVRCKSYMWPNAGQADQYLDKKLPTKCSQHVGYIAFNGAQLVTLCNQSMICWCAQRCTKSRGGCLGFWWNLSGE
eukprot:2749749-Amphidinium_carterae.1